LEEELFTGQKDRNIKRHHTEMKTIDQIHEEIQSALNAARQTHEYRAEGASIEFTNAMVARMRESGVSRSELARKIAANPAYISKILRGDTNFTLDTMVKIGNALGCEFRCHLQPAGAKSQWLDVYSSRTRKTSFQLSGMPRNVIRPAQFQRVDLPLETDASNEKLPAVA
jgi:plasmid maintenance system antidote protein VapI